MTRPVVRLAMRLVMRPATRSLQARMLLSSAVAAGLVTLLAGWAIGAVLEGFVMQGLDGRLDAELALLASSVDENGRVDRARLQRNLGGLATAPGWRWRIAGPDGAIGSDALRHLELPPAPGPLPADPALCRPSPPPGPGGPRPIDGADERNLPVHGRSLSIPTRRGPVVLEAEAPRSVLRRPIRAALVPLLSALAVLLGLLVLAALVQLRIGLAPVRRLREQVQAIRDGRRDRVDENQPSELQPLAVELNALAADNRAALAAARRTGVNLAHALKTPVAVLALDLRDDAERSAQLARIDATIRHHLRRARIETSDRRAVTRLAPAVAGLSDAIRHLHADRGLRIECGLPAGLVVAVDPHDLDEMLGNLLDNAARHARQSVQVSGGIDTADARRVRVRIADDGPGIPAGQRDAALRPGLRLDERGQGNGFGLPIAVELASLYGGVVRLDDRPGGGLAVEILLPGGLDG